MIMDINLDLPYLTQDLPGIGGKIRKTPDSFIVEEIPLYEPLDIGKHLYVNITKENLTTRQVQEKIANIFNISVKNVGFAGMKDKNAKTTQTFSISEYHDIEKAKEFLEKLPVKVNWLRFHKNKLKIGHLLGNKFKILITDFETSKTLERTQQIVNEIRKRGLPNFFGPQRFGFNGNNIQKGLDIIQGKLSINNRWMKKFLISSYQSYLCNKYLAYRLEKGLFNKILKGDIAKKYDTGGLFEVEDQEKEQERYENHEISFTAPIYGYKMWETTEFAKELESKILSDSDMTIEKLRSAKVKGTRRLGRLLVKDLSAETKKDGILLTFSLPKGAFATTLLREIMK
jgi:tRNA pseudouridine13 synthase